MLRSIARRLVRGIQPLVPAAQGVHVLAYHLVGAGTGGAVDVSVERFEADLDVLDGRVVSLGAALRGEAEAGSVVLTFDDAYANFYAEAFPRLAARRMPSVLYVPTGFIDRTHGVPIQGTEGLPPCTWANLDELVASGLVTIGAHTVTHPSLTGVSVDRATWELAAGRARLEDRLGVAVPDFCYPRGLWSGRLDRLVQAHYETAVIGGGRALRPGETAPTRLQRISLRADSPPMEALLARNVWLEERLADHVRHLRRRLA